MTLRGNRGFIHTPYLVAIALAVLVIVVVGGAGLFFAREGSQRTTDATGQEQATGEGGLTIHRTPLFSLTQSFGQTTLAGQTALDEGETPDVEETTVPFAGEARRALRLVVVPDDELSVVEEHLTIPASATHFTFDFHFEGLAENDWAEVWFNDTALWGYQGSTARVWHTSGNPYIAAEIPINRFANQTGRLYIRLYGKGESSALLVTNPAFMRLER